MLTSDLIDFGLASLRRQKLRTCLTLSGVIIGAAVLVISISVRLGVRETIDDQFRRNENLRHIVVLPNNDGYEDNYDGVPKDVLEMPGEMSEAKRERLRKLHVAQWKRRNTRPAPKPLTRERLEQLRQLPHVVSVIPELSEFGRAFLGPTQQMQAVNLYGVPGDFKRIVERIDQGQRFSSENAKECLVHEYLLYRWGIHDDSEVRDLIGQTVRVELTNARRADMRLLSLFDADTSNISEEEIRVLEKAWKAMPLALESLPLTKEEREILQRTLMRKNPLAPKPIEKTVIETFKIVGVVRAPDKDDSPDNGFLDSGVREADIILPRETADELFSKLPRREEAGYNRVYVVVDAEDNLQEVVDDVRKMGLHEFSMGIFVQTLRKNVALIGFTMNFMAFVALVVAAVGITNTMFTTVLERTREIGILKAVGAKDRQILCMFLIEGSLIGLIGGLGGLLVGWLASFPGNNYAISIMEKQGHKPLPETVFLYPLWLLICVPLFAMLVTTAAALLPARRASRVEPVVALRHE